VATFEIFEQDIERCHDVLGMDVWRTLAGKKIFFTGGTGFVGKWMLSALLDADERLSLGCKITLLSRNPEYFFAEWPELSRRLNCVSGDVRNFALPVDTVDLVVHAATDVASARSPDQIFDDCVDGTRRVLDLISGCGARRALLVSSGAVYGPLPQGMSHVPEKYLGGPDTLVSASAYAEGKRVSEWLMARAAGHGVEVAIARLFAVVGPHLPLDKHFAIGNFIAAALAKKAFYISGDGTPRRSYLYAADMAAWLWAVALRGNSGTAYNVGSEDSISIYDLAKRVAHIAGSQEKVQCAERISGMPVQHYVPDVTLAKKDLRLQEPLDLDEAISRTIRWYRKRQQK